MKKQVLAFTAFLLGASAVNAQYDTLWIGTADGPSTSLDNTPFPTEAHRAARTQYLVQSSVLQQLNLYPGTDIYGICLQVVDDDVTDPACLVNLHTESKNESTVNLTNFVYSGLVTTSTWPGVNLSAGILGLPWNTTTWQWLGAGNNMIIEINFERGDEAGLSPRIMLDMDLDYTATYTGRTDAIMTGHDITSSTPGVVLGSDNSLPVLGLLVDPSTGTHEHPSASRVNIFPNPANWIIDVQVPSGTRSIHIVDMCGRTVLQGPLASTVARMDVLSLPTGCYMVNTLSTEGLISSGRFIKE
jgi:hypothetical protein